MEYSQLEMNNLESIFIECDLHYFLNFFFIQFTAVTVVNETVQLSRVQFRNMSYVCCMVCSPPRVRSPIAMYLTPFILIFNSIIDFNCCP